MASLSQSTIEVTETGRKVSILRLAVSGAISAALIFVLCWLGTAIPYSSPTHAYISLFTNADITSGLALAEGTCWSLAFGAIVGVIFGLVYNATAPLSNR